MKLMKRSGIYKATNVTFDPQSKDAFSYAWWRFVGVVDGVLIFNNYRYSVTTAKHQRKVASIMGALGISPKLTLTLPRGIRHDQTLAELIVECEEHLCDVYLENEARREERNIKSRIKRLKKKLEDHLENVVHFRDYDIADSKFFGKPHSPIANKVAVHRVVDADSLERDVENALHSFHRDGFGSIVFYVGEESLKAVSRG